MLYPSLKLLLRAGLLAGALAALYASVALAQPTYTIPWAQKQPQFVFPFFLEADNGDRDTLYWALDSGVTFTAADSVYGAMFIPSKPQAFQVGHYNADSTKLMKVQVNNISLSGSGLIEAVPPDQFSVVMRWDTSLFSDTIHGFPYRPQYAGMNSFYIFFHQNAIAPCLIYENKFRFTCNDTLALPYYLFQGQWNAWHFPIDFLTLRYWDPFGVPAIAAAPPALVVYPNPAMQQATISAPCAGRLRLVDVTARVAWEQDIGAPGEVSLPLSGLCPGTYAVLLTGTRHTLSTRLVVTR